MFILFHIVFWIACDGDFAVVLVKWSSTSSIFLSVISIVANCVYFQFYKRLPKYSNFIINPPFSSGSENENCYMEKGEMIKTWAIFLPRKFFGKGLTTGNSHFLNFQVRVTSHGSTIKAEFGRCIVSCGEWWTTSRSLWDASWDVVSSSSYIHSYYQYLMLTPVCSLNAPCLPSSG